MFDQERAAIIGWLLFVLLIGLGVYFALQAGGF